MLLSPRHGKEGKLAPAMWARHGGFCLGAGGGGPEQEPSMLGGHSTAWHPAKGPPQHRSTLLACFERAPPFQSETPTGMQTVQARFIQTSLRR